MTIQAEGPVEVVMPHLSPGSPTNSLNHDARIRKVLVSGQSGQSLPYQRLKEGGYRIENEARGPVTVHYVADANSFSHVRNHLVEDHAYLNGPAALMFVRGREAEPSVIELTEVAPGWESLASLPRAKDKAHTFFAPTYDDIADTSIFLGELNQASETVEGTRLVVNNHGTPPWPELAVNGASPQESLADLKALYQVFLENFGPFPLERYEHLPPRPPEVEQTDKYVLNKHYIHSGPRSPGGYELYHGHELLLHKASQDSIKKKYHSDGRAYERAIMAHELVHKLLAKLVVHDGIDAHDLAHVHKTDGLWFTEGVTDWAGVQLERQAGLLSQEHYLDHLQGFYRRYQSDLEHNPTSPTDDSLDAHIGISNYYNKGAVAATLLDLEIRQASAGKACFFDVLRDLKEEFGGTGRGHTLDDIERLSQKAAGPPGKERIQEFFARHLRGREPFDLNRSLTHVGLELVEVEKEPATPLDEGGPLELAQFGLTLKPNQDGRLAVDRVERGGPAYRAGLADFRGQLVQNLDAQEALADSTCATFTFETEDRFTGKTVTRTVQLSAEPATETILQSVDQPTPAQLALRRLWLEG